MQRVRVAHLFGDGFDRQICAAQELLIVVYLMDGTWELDETLSFGEADSGTNGHNIWYKAYGDAEPMLSGGTKLTGQWTQTTLENGKTAYTIPLNRETKLRALYVNGERRYMAHTEQAINAQGAWGTYTIGETQQDADYQWETIYSEDFEGESVSVGGEKDAIQKYDKNGDLENSVINVVEESGNHMLQIAHTANDDCGFEIPSVTYQNGLITYRFQLATGHNFTHEWEALHMHGADKTVGEKSRTAWAGVKLAPHMQKTYFQYGTSGGGLPDENVTDMINVTNFTPESGVWYQVKMMVTADGQYLTKIWKESEQEPNDWSRSDSFNNLMNEDKFFRVYAYKNNDNTKIDIRIDDIVIQSGTKQESAPVELPDWAWTTGSKFDGITYHTGDLAGISADSRNIADIEIENQQVWNKNTVCVREIADNGDGKTVLKLQQPYGAIAQTPGWTVGLQGTGSHMIYNAYELLDTPGEFYFDRAADTLYYIPIQGENMETADVVVPRLETVVEFKGSPAVEGNPTAAGETTITGQVENIIFDGISVAHSDWLLQKVGNSYGKSTVQAGTTYTAFASGNWHADMYRNLDTIPGAVEMEFAHHIRLLNGAIQLTGAEGVLLSNDVDGCEVTGNYIYQTGGGGVVVGSPQHIYENDSLEPETYYYHYIPGDGKPEVSADGAAATHEKYQNGTERVPRDVTVSNNLLVENCRLFPSHCPITSFFTQNLEVSNNFIKNAAYSGMSIGWGWCNFDGKDGSFMDWGTQNNQGGSILPGIPTETCKNNKIINNRIDTVMTILHDGGLIYTLGSQPGTILANNYVANSQNHGIYTDEGSAYFAEIADNVVENPASSAIFAVEYGRKHDLTFSNTYSNHPNAAVATAPSINIHVEDFHYIPDAMWPKEASDIVQQSGLTTEYRVKFADALAELSSSVSDALLPADASLNGGEKLTLNAWLDASDEIWLAPAGTTEFVDGQNMVKAAGNAAEIATTGLAGEYRLYVKQGGTYSAASKHVVHVEADLVTKVEMALASKDLYTPESLAVLQAAYDTYGEAAAEGDEVAIAQLQTAFDSLVPYFAYDYYYDAQPKVVGVTTNGIYGHLGFTMESIVDGKIEDMNGWHGADNAPDAYITIDLGKSQTISELMMAPRPGDYLQRLPKDCDVYVSETAPTYDGSTISGLEESSKVASVSFTTGGYGDTQPLPAGTTGRYVTIHVKNLQGDTCINVSEIALKIKGDSSEAQTPDCDVNDDGKVDILDLTTAQGFYQAKAGTAEWSKAQRCDVNGDQTVDLMDLILVSMHITDNTDVS